VRIAGCRRPQRLFTSVGEDKFAIESHIVSADVAGVGTRAAVEHVVTSATGEVVLAGASRQLIVVGATGECVLAGAAEEPSVPAMSAEAQRGSGRASSFPTVSVSLHLSKHRRAHPPAMTSSYVPGASVPLCVSSRCQRLRRGSCRTATTAAVSPGWESASWNRARGWLGNRRSASKDSV
jgi:hypothetical protein